MLRLCGRSWRGRGETIITSLSSSVARRSYSSSSAAAASAENTRTRLLPANIGLELHVQIASKSKLFSRASAAPLQPANTQVAAQDMALPGTLPMINERCVEAAVMTGLALQGTVQQRSRFDRKHYMYSDLPHGFQITQKDYPIVTDGVMHIDRSGTRVGIERIQLEIDSGKSMHDVHPFLSLIDLNRAGVGLMEIVTLPDLQSAEDAGKFVEKMQSLLIHLGVSSVAMEEGAMRCDVNVSVRHDGLKGMGERVELKNLSSIRSIRMAIAYEIARQSEVVQNGGVIERETRQFDSFTNKSILMRSKENLLQYRFYPEPDLLELHVSDAMLAGIRQAMPELPDAVFARYTTALKLSVYDAEVIVGTPGAIQFFEDMLNRNNNDNSSVTPKVACNWFSNEFLGRINKARKNNPEQEISLSQPPVSPVQLHAIASAVACGDISGVVGKALLDELFDINGVDATERRIDVSQVIQDRGLAMSSDGMEIEALCMKVMLEHANTVNEFRDTGNTRLVGFLIKEAIAASQQTANPKVLSKTMFRLMKDTK